jgi:hypothetical protein
MYKQRDLAKKRRLEPNKRELLDIIGFAWTSNDTLFAEVARVTLADLEITSNYPRSEDPWMNAYNGIRTFIVSRVNILHCIRCHISNLPCHVVRKMDFHLLPARQIG